jgi:peroxiredoxin
VRQSMIRTALIFIILFFFGQHPARPVTISGSDSAYAGVEIIWLKAADPFTATEVEVARTTFDAKGRLHVEFSLDHTGFIYCYLGIYRTYLYVEKGKEYEVVLPPRKDMKDEDKLNPFFRHIETHLALKNADKRDLNIQIRMFNDSFYPYFAKHNEKVFSDDLEFDQLDQDIIQLDKPFSKSANSYFNNYRKYKYGLLRFIAYQHKSKSVSDIYFKNQAFLPDNPAYVELFNMVYEGYFEHFSRTEHGKLLAPAIASKRLSEVQRVLAHDEVLQPAELLNMVMLRCLHDEFYDDNYSRSSMLAIVDSLIAVTENELLLTTAISIREKVTKLLVGFEPPPFELYDMDSNLVSLETFKGKFIYLNFCSCFSYTCLNEFVMLQNLHNKHNKYLEIVTVVIDDDVQVMKDFVNRSGYPWTFLHFDNQPDIFREYDVRVFPTYYLIDNEGKLSMSPAPAPAEEFEGRLFKVLRAKGIL